MTRHAAAKKMLIAQREAEAIIARCADAREQLRQLAENAGAGFSVAVATLGTVTVEWRPQARPIVVVKLDG